MIFTKDIFFFLYDSCMFYDMTCMTIDGWSAKIRESSLMYKPLFGVMLLVFDFSWDIEQACIWSLSLE